MVKITYKPGDKVFAKVKGYPPWPAKVVSDIGKNKFNVLFYGTQETGKIKQENLAFYLKYKKDYVHKYVKRAGYVDAVNKIEEDLIKEGVDINDIDFDSSDRNLDTTSDDTSSTAEKSTPRSKFHKTADTDEPAATSVKKRGRRKISSASSDTNTVTASAKKFRRESTSSVASKSSKTEEEIVAPKSSETVKKDSEVRANSDAAEEMESADDNNDKDDASEMDQAAEVPKNDKVIEDEEEPTLEKNKKEEEAETKKHESDEVEAEEVTRCDKKPKDDLEIITKRMLNNFILYAEHVKKNPALYKEKPVETTRDATEKDIYAFKLPSGKVCGVRLYKTWPPKHSNEYERALYDREVADAALEAETLLTTEKKTLGEIEMEVVPDIEINEKELKSICSIKDLHIDARKRILARQEIETKLVKWDFKLKSTLGLDNAQPDDALDTLKQFEEFENELDVLMFKKNPHVLDTLRRLRKYVGNAREWTISHNDLENFIKKAGEIRVEADSVYSKVQSMFAFDVKDDKGIFWDSFMQVVSDFRMKCKELTEPQILELCAEPDSRLAFFDLHLNDKPTGQSAEKI